MDLLLGIEASFILYASVDGIISRIKKYIEVGAVHLNENYRGIDPDLIFGTIAFGENLKMYYYLNRYNFSGWNEIDIIVPRDDRIKSLKLAVKMTIKYNQLAERLIKNKNVIDKNLKGYHFADNIDLITDLLFK